MNTPTPSPAASPKTHPRVVLVGPPGVGKTTVGRLLAQHWHVAFCDTDDIVSSHAGRPVADIFIDSGEQHFRALERQAVADAVAEFTGVLALGGGAVVDAGTRDLLGDQQVVFLDVGLADAAKRVGLNRDRPLLLGNVRGQWLELMAARRPWYEAVADVVVPTDGLDPGAVVDAIVAALSAGRRAAPAVDPAR